MGIEVNLLFLVSFEFPCDPTILHKYAAEMGRVSEKSKNMRWQRVIDDSVMDQK